jgi:hypothetical protein
MYRYAALLLCLCSCLTAAAQTLDAFVYTLSGGTTPMETATIRASFGHSQGTCTPTGFPRQILSSR